MQTSNTFRNESTKTPSWLSSATSGLFFLNSPDTCLRRRGPNKKAVVWYRAPWRFDGNDTTHTEKHKQKHHSTDSSSPCRKTYPPPRSPKLEKNTTGCGMALHACTHTHASTTPLCEGNTPSILFRGWFAERRPYHRSLKRTPRTCFAGSGASSVEEGM